MDVKALLKAIGLTILIIVGIWAIIWLICLWVEFIPIQAALAIVTLFIAVLIAGEAYHRFKKD